MAIPQRRIWLNVTRREKDNGLFYSWRETARYVLGAFRKGKSYSLLRIIQPGG